MKIAFRVDSSDLIGTGHFVRCLTLADVLRKHGAETRFICRHLPGHLQKVLAEKGHGLRLLATTNAEPTEDSPAHAAWLGTSQRADAQDSLGALAGEVWDCLVVDHYALDARWETTIRPAVRKILVIDDLADRAHECDWLLDQNFYVGMESRYDSKVPPHCQLLLGPKYALLREEFGTRHETIEPRAGAVRRLLVFFGGVDQKNHTGCALEALARLGRKDLAVDAVIGAGHPQREKILSTCAEHEFSCHVQTNRMAELMAEADLAIGAGGTATWERLCLGLPTLAIATAENQVEQMADAAAAVLLYAPDAEEDATRVIEEHLPALLDNGHLREAISRRALETVDGRGVWRVLSLLSGEAIEIRKAGAADSKNIHAWRNHPEIRKTARHQEVIAWSDHEKWYERTLSSHDNPLLIGEHGETPVGVVRYDLQQEEAEVSIYLVPGQEGRGRGRQLLKKAEEWLCAHRPEVKKIHAHVLGGNERSRSLFLEAGYEVASTHFAKLLKPI